MMRASFLASGVAEKLGRLDDPWDVYAERATRFEIQLTGSKVEVVRGPLRLEGYGVRVLTKVDDQTGVGFQASVDFTPEGIRHATEAARTVAKFNRFPARHPALPEKSGGVSNVPKLRDPKLGSDPLASLEEEARALLAAFEAERLAPPTFATLRATLLESSIANSRGLADAFAHTAVEREIAVKADGGPEGAPAGEFWVNDLGCRIHLDRPEEKARRWWRLAEDARHADAPPTGETAVILPRDVLAEILPPVFGTQFSAAGQLRGLAIPTDTVVATERLDVSDDGLLDWAVGSSPFDDEGTRQRVRRLIVQGRVSEIVSDVLHADALGSVPTGNAMRGMKLGPGAGFWWKFARPPSPGLSTLTLSPGDGGSDEELVEQVDDGLWLEQLGWAAPDLVAGTFGAEIRIGYRIRRGKLAEPIRGGTVGGPVVTRDHRPSMLNGIQSIGSEAHLSGDLLSPTLVVRNLVVSGTSAASSSPPR